MSRIPGGPSGKRRKRRAVVERDGDLCAYCGTTEGLTLDHRVPLCLGGPAAIWNLQLLCHRCNNAKGDTGAGREATLRWREFGEARRGSSVEERGIPNPRVAGSTPALGSVGYALLEAGIAA